MSLGINNSVEKNGGSVTVKFTNFVDPVISLISESICSINGPTLNKRDSPCVVNLEAAYVSRIMSGPFAVRAF